MTYVRNRFSSILLMLVRNHGGDDICEEVVILDKEESDECDGEQTYAKA